MGIDNFKGGLEVAEKKSKPFFSFKKSKDLLANDKKSSLEIKKVNSKLDSDVASSKNISKSHKINSNNSSSKKVISKNVNGHAASNHESSLANKAESAVSSEIKPEADSAKASADSSKIGKPLKNFKVSNKKEQNGKVNSKGKSNLKAKNELQPNSTALNESDSSNKEASKNQNKKTKRQAKQIVEHVFDLQSLPDVSKLSPKSKEWVGNLFPVLECYDFTLPEILTLIKRNDYNPDKIENAVSLIIQVQSGHEQGEWKTIGVKPPKPKEQDKGKAYNEKVNNYFKALKAQALENEKKKQERQNQLKKNLTKTKAEPQKNGVEVEESASNAPKSEQVPKPLDNINLKKGSSSFDSNKPFNNLAENLIESSKTTANGKTVAQPESSNTIKDVVVPKLADMSLKGNSSGEFKPNKLTETERNLRKMGKAAIKAKQASDKEKEKELKQRQQAQQLNPFYQQFQSQVQQRQYQNPNYPNKSYSNYPHYPHYGFPDYPQQPMPTYQHYQDPAILSSYPNYKGFQPLMPDMSKYTPNTHPMMVSQGFDSLSVGAKSSSAQKTPSSEADKDKLLAEEAIKSSVAQASKLGSSGLNEGSLWTEQDKDIAQPGPWKGKSSSDQNTQTASGTSRDVPVINSQSHVYTSNYSMPPGLSTSYPYSYSSYYNPNYNGMMYSTQNPQMHSQHLMSYNQYDSSYKYMNGPPGLNTKVNNETESNLVEGEQANSKFETGQDRSFVKSHYEGIHNPPGLTNYYSQYNPYGNHSSSYNNMSNWG